MYMIEEEWPGHRGGALPQGVTGLCRGASRQTFGIRRGRKKPRRGLRSLTEDKCCSFCLPKPWGCPVPAVHLTVQRSTEMSQVPGQERVKEMPNKSNLHAKASPSFSPHNPRLVQANQYFMKTFPSFRYGEGQIPSVKGRGRA